jgi:hypothetical protein
MTTQINIEQRVMANVGVIYSTRKVFSTTALKAYVLVLSALALWRLVWVTKVMQNFAIVEKNGIAAVGNYVVSAVVHTHPIVQVTLAVAAIAFILLFADLFRATSTKQQFSF